MTLAIALLAAHAVGPVTVAVQPWGSMDGKPVHLYHLKNRSGAQVDLTDYGARIVRILVPDRKGQLGDVTTGFDSVQGFADPNDPYFGAIVGRYGNRIAKGRFRLDGKAYKLATNNGPNHLHGGNKGFDKRVWSARPLKDGVVLTYVSRAGEEGYPGTLTATVTYRFTEGNEVQIGYEVRTTAPTVFNLTNHTYFNLSAGESTDILGHRLTLDADRYTPIDATSIPTGNLPPVAGTPFDFRKPTLIGARINADDPQIKNGSGYDHNFVVRGRMGTFRRAARLEDPSSGRTLEVWTTEPGIQFYSGNFLDGTLTGKGGTPYPKRYAMCLETQHFPDSPNHPAFPTTTLRPGQTYRSKTSFRFGVK